MLDYNIFKWNWSQRLLLLAFVFTYWIVILHPYAFLETETISKTYAGSRNLLLHASMISLFISILPCYGLIAINPQNYVLGALGCYGANLLFLVVGYTKDHRLPTWFVLIGIIGVFVTIGISFLDRTMYCYEER